MNIQVNSLMLEVTRRCNLQCTHCLRGCAQNLDMDKVIVDKVIADIGWINGITFSGGEPTLNFSVIKHFTDLIVKEYPIGSFFVATNGTFYSQELINCLKKLYVNCEDPDSCVLAISRDQFREDVDLEVLYQYLPYRFFYDEVKNENIENVLNKGLAYENGVGEINKEPNRLYVEQYDNYLEVETIYVNARGDVLTDCDLSYEEQEEYKIGNILNENLEDIVMREYNRLEKSKNQVA